MPGLQRRASRPVGLVGAVIVAVPLLTGLGACSSGGSSQSGGVAGSTEAPAASSVSSFVSSSGAGPAVGTSSPTSSGVPSSGAPSSGAASSGAASSGAASSGAATGSAASTPYPTDVPAAALANTDAQAFIKYYFSLLNRAQRGPVAGLLPPLSTPSCGACSGFEQASVELTRDKQHYLKDPVTVVEVDRDARSTAESPRYVVLIQQNAAAIADEGNHPVQQMEAKKAMFAVSLVRGRDGWLVASIKVGQ